MESSALVDKAHDLFLSFGRLVSRLLGRLVDFVSVGVFKLKYRGLTLVLELRVIFLLSGVV